MNLHFKSFNLVQQLSHCILGSSKILDTFLNFGLVLDLYSFVLCSEMMLDYPPEILFDDRCQLFSHFMLDLYPYLTLEFFSYSYFKLSPQRNLECLSQV